jgi:hypothetical protein
MLKSPDQWTTIWTDHADHRILEGGDWLAFKNSTSEWQPLILFALLLVFPLGAFAFSRISEKVWHLSSDQRGWVGIVGGIALCLGAWWSWKEFAQKRDAQDPQTQVGVILWKPHAKTAFWVEESGHRAASQAHLRFIKSKPREPSVALALVMDDQSQVIAEAVGFSALSPLIARLERAGLRTEGLPE